MKIDKLIQMMIKFEKPRESKEQYIFMAYIVLNMIELVVIFKCFFFKQTE